MRRQKRDHNQSPIIHNPRKRLLAVVLLAAFSFAAIAGKLFAVMVVQGEGLQTRAVTQWMRDVPVEAPRGRILDRNGEVLADTATRYNIYVRPAAVGDKEATARLLAEVFGYAYEDALDKISTRASEVTVARGAEKEELDALIASGLPGIYYGEDNLRYYPYGDFMTQVLGFTGFDGEGQTGLEAYYEKYLRGTDGAVLTDTDLVGRELEGGGSHYLPAVRGMDIVTTLDAGVQRIAEGALRNINAKFSPKGATCVVMNYMTGEILALAETPSFDLNNVPRDDLSALFGTSKSKTVSTVYEPGSTFKIFTTAAALEAGVVTAGDRFFCPGFKLVEIHGAHGYLLTNFFSPTTNHRTDLYGGSLENRFRLVGRILQAAREACGPEMALLGRDNGLEFYRYFAAHYPPLLAKGGWLAFEIGAAQGPAVAQLLRDAGASAVQILADGAGRDRVVRGQFL